MLLFKNVKIYYVLKLICFFIEMSEHPNAEMLAPDFSKRSR